jgi:ribosome-associated toxin RatA of RatAB toxin-antitoxin module
VDRSTSSIVIDAPMEQIMDAIADVESYPEWAPGVAEVEIVDSGDGARPKEVRFTLLQAGFRDHHTYVYQWLGVRDGMDSVTWHLTEPAGMVQHLEGVYELAPHPEGGTEVTYSLAVDVSIPILGMLRRRAERVIIDSALHGLRRRVTG